MKNNDHRSIIDWFPSFPMPIGFPLLHAGWQWPLPILVPSAVSAANVKFAQG
jgi:hypothetical protein